RCVGLAQRVQALDLDPFRRPIDDVPNVGEGDAGIFGEHPLGGDAEAGGARRHILEFVVSRAVRRFVLSAATRSLRWGGAAPRGSSCQEERPPNSVSVATLYQIDPDLSTSKC